MLPAEFASNNHPEEHPENNLVYTEKRLTEFFNSVSSEDAEFQPVNQVKNAKANQVAQPLSKISQSEENNEYTPAAGKDLESGQGGIKQKGAVKHLKYIYVKFY